MSATHLDDEGCASADELRTKLADFDYVRFLYTDIVGLSRHKLIPTRHVLQGHTKSGVYSGIVACGPLTEAYVPEAVEKVNYANAMLRPMAGTCHPATWISKKYRTAQVLCETFWLDGRVQEAHPRTLARRQLARLDQSGYSLLAAFEPEFIIVDKQTMKPVFPSADYCCTLSFRPFEEFFMNADQHMLPAGVDLEGVHAEHAPGQIETILRPSQGIAAADQAFLLKSYLKEELDAKNLLAIYMASPFNKDAEATNGCHFNFSLWNKDATNAFYDNNQSDSISNIGRWWLGGLVKHAVALSALCNPTVNCYRRFHQPWAPDYNDWNIDDRMATFRVKNYGPRETYFENRLPSGVCNPYIVMAATVAAGLDGVAKRLEPPPKGREESILLPNSLEEALSALKQDTALCDALGKEFVEWFVGCKHEVDLIKLDKSKFANDEEALKAEWDEYARLC